MYIPILMYLDPYTNVPLHVTAKALQGPRHCRTQLSSYLFPPQHLLLDTLEIEREKQVMGVGAWSIHSSRLLLGVDAACA